MFGLVTEPLVLKMKDTTDIMLSDGRFIELTEEELLKLQNGRQSFNTNDTKKHGTEMSVLSSLYFVCCYPLSGIVGAGGAGMPSHIS